MSAAKKVQALLIIASLFVSATVLAQTETPATLPASFVGTYETVFSSSFPGTSIPNRASVVMVIGSDNTLCVDGVLLSNPVLRNGNPAEAIWKDAASSVEYAVSNITASFNEFNVAGPDGSPAGEVVFYGQLTGSKVSDSTVCESSSGASTTTTTPVATDAINQIFALAESKLPQIFTSGAITLTFEQYVYRFYPDTSVYLAFTNDTAFLLGGAFGQSLVNIGSVSTVLTSLEALEVEVATGGSTGGGSADLWNLSISGSFNSSLVQNIAFAGINLAGIPAPDLNDTNAVNNEIGSSLAGIATGLSAFSITVVNNTDTRRTFDVSFSATLSGLGAVTYNLRYDYTR